MREARVPVLVDFWAAWCGPCKMSAPEVAAVAREMAGRALVVKVDADAHPEIAARFQVQGIPNFVVLHNGRWCSSRPASCPVRRCAGGSNAPRPTRRSLVRLSTL